LTAQPVAPPTDTARLLELARYTRAVLQAYLESESEDLAGLVKWIEHEIGAISPQGRPQSGRDGRLLTGSL
jgi:hypothetical protein